MPSAAHTGVSPCVMISLGKGEWTSEQVGTGDLVQVLWEHVDRGVCSHAGTLERLPGGCGF